MHVFLFFYVFCCFFLCTNVLITFSIRSRAFLCFVLIYTFFTVLSLGTYVHELLAGLSLCPCVSYCFVSKHTSFFILCSFFGYMRFYALLLSLDVCVFLVLCFFEHALLVVTRVFGTCVLLGVSIIPWNLCEPWCYHCFLEHVLLGFTIVS